MEIELRRPDARPPGAAWNAKALRLAAVVFFAMRLATPAAEAALDGEAVAASGEVMMAAASVARLAEQADRMMVRYEYDAALDTANRGLAIDPVYIPLWRVKAMAHIALSQHEEAEEALEICLLRNPDDIEAHVLGLKSAFTREGVDRTDRIRGISALLRDMDRDLLADALAAFVRSRDFPEYASLLLEAWQRTDGPLNAARAVLMEYSGNHMRAAAELASDQALAGLRPALAGALRDLVDQAMDRRNAAVWAVERGGLIRDGDRIRLSASPESTAFAWLRMSADWKNVSASIRCSDAVDAVGALYLRYQSPESYVRVSVSDGVMLVQERVPGLGLSTLREVPFASLGGQPLRLVLKGERLEAYAGERPLTEGAIPVSSLIADGKAALSCENRARGMVEALFDEVEISRIEPGWITLSGRESREAAAGMFKASDVTGVIAALGGEGQASETLPSLLLAAVNSGLTVCALLPEGSTDLQELQAPSRRLPRMLAERLWSGAAARPSADMDFRDLDAFLVEIKGRGLQSGIYATPGTARRLAGYDGDLYADWLLVEDAGSLPASTLAALGKFCGAVLFEDPGSKGRFVAKDF